MQWTESFFNHRHNLSDLSAPGGGGISVYAINHKKQDVAEQSSAQTENISLDTVIIYFGNLDKNSIIVVYKIENSTN